jgi:dephospho-CoA kinase
MLARDAVAPGTAGLAAVVRRFGADVCEADGTLNRRKVGDIVFHDPQARRDLEQIIHPYVREMTDRWFASLDPERVPFALADIPLLFEGQRQDDFDTVIVTACEPETQLRRLMARDGLDEAQARQRIAAQWPLETKMANADYVIRTDGTFDETNRQVDAVAARLRSSALA